MSIVLDAMTPAAFAARAHGTDCNCDCTGGLQGGGGGNNCNCRCS